QWAVVEDAVLGDVQGGHEDVVQRPEGDHLLFEDDRVVPDEPVVERAEIGGECADSDRRGHQRRPDLRVHRHRETAVRSRRCREVARPCRRGRICAALMSSSRYPSGPGRTREGEWDVTPETQERGSSVARGSADEVGTSPTEQTEQGRGEGRSAYVL